MSLVPTWVERKFDFHFPADLYPNILARLRGTSARLEDAVCGLSFAQLTGRQHGKWSIQENAGHLLDEEDLFWRRTQEFLAGAATLTPATYEHRELTHNRVPIESILANFRRTRARHVQYLESLRLEDFCRVSWHSRLGLSMRLVDHLYFFAEHDDHHLARIWELRRDRSNPL